MIFKVIIRPVILILAILSYAGLAVSNDTGKNTRHSINWEGIRQLRYNDEQKDYLSFSGALFLDSMPGIPYFFERIKLDVPHISYDVSLSGVEPGYVSSKEGMYLKEKGFKPGEYIVDKSIVYERGERYLEVRVVPVRYNSKKGVFEKLLSFTLEKDYVYDAKYGVASSLDFVEESVLNNDDWYKVCVDQTGIYRLNFPDLVELGIDPSSVKRGDFSLFGNGAGVLPELNNAPRYDDLKENAIYLRGDPGGYFSESDYILFYGKSPHKWEYNKDNDIWEHNVHPYSDENCYFLTTGGGEGKRIPARNSLSETATKTINRFRDVAYHQEDLHNLISSGRVWYGEVFNVVLSRDFIFSFDDLVEGGEAHLKTHVAGRSDFSTSFSVKVSDKEMQMNIAQTATSSNTGDYAKYSEKSTYFDQTSSDITVSVKYNRRTSGDIGWLNYIALNVERELRFQEPQLLFRQTGLEDDVAEFRVSNCDDNVKVWDVSDRFNIKNQRGELEGSNFIFRAEGKDKMNFIVHDGSGYLEPALKGKISNQNLHGKRVHDLVIVTPPDFIDEADRLASFRRENDGLSVLVVTTDQVYNEFSSGIPDKSAIRNFMKMFYDRAEGSGQMPRYLLLFGNGTYDNKDILGFGGNLIPTFQTRESLNQSSSWITDDYFGLLADGEGENAGGNLDLGIGRLPVRTINDAAAVVDKITRYDKRIEGWDVKGNNYEFAGMVSNYGDWRNKVALIADDGDNNVHLADAEDLYELMKQHYPVYNIEKIYLDSYDKVIMAGGERYPEVNKSINKLVNKGVLLINYIGHGGFNGLAHERVLTFDDIQTWNNFYNLPVFMTATCEFSAFDKPDPSSLSAGVRIFLKRNGGASALFTTTRLAWTGSNRKLNNHFMTNTFKPMENGEYPRLGDMIRKAKVASGSGNQIMNFVLLGDPSMQLASPRYNVETTKVPDTIRAFDHVNIEGRVVDDKGRVLNDYNGIIYPTIYDKKRILTTLGNSSDSKPREFEMRTNNLFRGKASVKNGLFSFDFIVPKDIGYSLGEGKISYYLDDGNNDGHGYYEGFYVGGSSDDYKPDHDGPQIDLYLNDTTFTTGETVNSNPLLLAYIFDESGINTTGGLGHDIIAFLDENSASQYVLNDYYEADIDTYKSGKVVYPLSDLEEGKHTLNLRVWDVHNNPSVASIDFIIAPSLKFALENLVNYPNPFSYNTTFEFSHNNSDAYEMDVKIEIFDLLGKKVTSMQRQMNLTGFDAFRVDWNGTGYDGRMLESGMYIYNVLVTTPDGETASESSKLFIMR